MGHEFARRRRVQPEQRGREKDDLGRMQTEHENEEQQQGEDEQGRLSALCALPPELLWRVQECLDVPTLLQLSAVNREWSRTRLGDAQWREIYWQRFGVGGVGGGGGGGGGGPRGGCRRAIISASTFRLLGVSHFWCTVEAAFLGLPALQAEQDEDGEARFGAEDVQQQQQQQQRHIWHRLFAMVQPRMRGSPSPLRYLAMLPTGRGQGPGVGGEREEGKAMGSYWKLACALQARGMAMVTCALCQRMDMHTEHTMWVESLPTRAAECLSPCQCPRVVVHRQCFEQKIVRHEAVGRFWISLDDRAAVANYQRILDAFDLGACEQCHAPYRAAFRLPGSAAELLWISAQDRFAWWRALKCALVWLALVVVVSVLETITLQAETLQWPQPGGLTLAWFLWQQVVLLDIFCSDRFMQVVTNLWRGPIFPFYTTLYAYFTVACCTMGLVSSPLFCRFLLPLLLTGDSGLFGDGAVDNRHCKAVRASSVWMSPHELIRMGNATVYAVVSTAVIVIFWRTNYRVLTVADARRRQRAPQQEHPLLRLSTQ